MPGDNRLPKPLSRLFGLLRADLCVIIYIIGLQVCFAGHGRQNLREFIGFDSMHQFQCFLLST